MPRSSTVDQTKRTGLGRFTDWLDNRFNPVVVRDIRCWLRSKFFLIVFFVALLIIQIVTLGFCLSDRSNHRLGEDLFALLVGGLGFVLVGVIPFLVHNKFTDELGNKSTELAFMSKLDPGRLVRGKIASGVIGGLLFFSATGPSLMIAYILGGVTITSVLYVFAVILFFTVVAMLLSVFVVSLFNNKRLKLLGVPFFGAGVAMSVIAFGIIEEGDSLFRDKEFIIANVVGGLGILLVSLFFYFVSVSRLSFPSENQDFKPRVFLTIMTMLTYGIVVFANALDEKLRGSWGVDPEIFAIATIVSAFIFFSGLLFLLNTPDFLSGRIKQQWSKVTVVKLFYMPGPGRLYAYILVHILFLILGVVPSLLWRGYVSHSVREATIVAVACLTVGLVVVSSGTLVHQLLCRISLFRFFKQIRGTFVVLLGILWSLLGLVVAIIGDFADLPDEFFLVSPATALYYVGDDPELSTLIPFLIAMAFMAAWPVLFWMKQIFAAIVENNLVTKQYKHQSAP